MPNATSAAMSASAGMTTYSAAPPTRSVKAVRRNSKLELIRLSLMYGGAAMTVGSPPPCREGVGGGVEVITRAGSSNDHPPPQPKSETFDLGHLIRCRARGGPDPGRGGSARWLGRRPAL